MDRILIIGSPGSGKSTLSLLMSEKLGLPVVHLDKLFWRPGWVEASREEFDAALAEALMGEKWIIDGNYGRTLKMRLSRADTVIMPDYPTAVCVFRVLKRIITNRGRTRPDMGEDCPERLDWEFLRYVMDFRRKNRQKLLDALSDWDGKTVFIRNKREYRKFLLTLKPKNDIIK